MMQRTQHNSRVGRRGFSLIEVLMAIFILSVGVISISALFPAGIVQQQRGADDVIGPIIADNAMAIIRSKVDPSLFSDLDSSAYNISAADLPLDVGSESTAMPFTSLQVNTDWPWLRPSMIHDPTDPFNPLHGAIDIFSSQYVRATQGVGPSVDGNLQIATEFPGGLGSGLYGIPFDTDRAFDENGSSLLPFERVITRQERFYPQQSASSAGGPEDFEKPQYVWDCMFRRYNGRIQVAIFVYRVIPPPGFDEWVYYSPYRLDNGTFGADVPYLPERLNLVTPAAEAAMATQSQWSAYNHVDLSNESPITPYVVRGVDGGEPWDEFNPYQSWSAAGQWLVTQNNEVMRVLSNQRDDESDPLDVELIRPPMPMLDLPSNYFFGTGAAFTARGGIRYDGSVTHIWYLPRQVEFDVNDDSTTDLTVTIEPVFATVREL
ncbi:MAG: prepilin-type N-terminal cleavage/methylation domain-containing protein [Planctomycetota bacterium]